MPIITKLGGRATSFTSTKSTKSAESESDWDDGVGSPVALTSDSSAPALSAEDLALDPQPQEPVSEQGKAKQLLSILRKCISKELTSVRISLPPSLLSGKGNLEYWQYCDYPPLFVTLGQGNELDRMLGVVRWTFTKDLKFVKDSIQKPYNSILGEHFHCYWEVQPVLIDPKTGAPQPASASENDKSTTSTTASSGMPSVDATLSKSSESEAHSAELSGSSSESNDSQNPTSAQPEASPGDPDEQANSRFIPIDELELDTATAGQPADATASQVTATDDAKAEAQVSSEAPASNESQATSGTPSQGTEEVSEDSDKQTAAAETQSAANTVDTAAPADKTRVVFLNEQISHHPPISHFMLEARTPHGRVRCIGADQLSAKFTGTNVKVFPGPWNHGLFVSFPDFDDEEYQITHPTASVAGVLRGSPYATIGGHTYITRKGGLPSGKKYRAIIAYTEESWITKAKFAIEGIIYEMIDDTDTEFSKIKQVPADRVTATLSGSWHGEIRYKLAGESEERLLVDLGPLELHSESKVVAPLDEQHELETRKVWHPVTQALRKKDWPSASKHKVALEQKQRDEAAERKKKGEVHKPRFFEPQPDELAEWDGRPKLTAAGVEDIEKQFRAQYTGENSG